MELLIHHRAWWTASWTSLISPYIRKRQQTCWVRWKYYLTHCLLLSNYLLCYIRSRRKFTQNHQIILPNFLWEMAKNKSLSKEQKKQAQQNCRLLGCLYCSGEQSQGTESNRASQFLWAEMLQLFGSTVSYDTVLCLYLKIIQRYYRPNCILWSSYGPCKMDPLTARGPVPIVQDSLP